MASDNYLVNVCESRHIPQLVELWKEYLVDQGNDPINSYIDFNASTDGFRRILEGYLKKEPQGFFVATVGDEVVGFLLAFGNALSDNYVMKKRVGKIQIVHVKRGFRQRGIATSLMREAIGYLAAIGCSAVLAETGEDNTRSLKVLTRLGFKQRERLVTLIHEL
ncbi:MAG: GNAT family N-acetyltransferase [Candidatus Bathyarchaeota archaeon]|jgi:ribosomal protein S18 acetylase RimI-like enzyme|nr:GNAT family N-acetyltransferase [Candidatus Bathyarchaeota archaeon]